MRASGVSGVSYNGGVNEFKGGISGSGSSGGRRARVRELGIQPGVLATGSAGSITDVPGVLVGQVTLIEGTDVRTGVTVVRPHAGNLYRERVPAGLAVGNGFGKLIGATQVDELGELETPIVLTNTLAAPRAADALVSWVLRQPGNEAVTSVNPFVGETNDSVLNDIRTPSVQSGHVVEALESAGAGPVDEGGVGAGTGTVCFGHKGGIGTSSRQLPGHLGGYLVGVLVQSNYGGVLQFDGLAIGKQLGGDSLPAWSSADGSIMIVLATDAPVTDRNLRRLAARCIIGLGRTGSAMSNGSGDYAVAFSTSAEVRRLRDASHEAGGLSNDRMSPLFLAAIEATEEAILNSLSMAEGMSGWNGNHVPALPLEVIGQLLTP